MKTGYILYNNSQHETSQRDIMTNIHTLYMIYQLYGYLPKNMDIVLFGTGGSYDWLSGTRIHEITKIIYFNGYDDKTMFLNRLFMLTDCRIADEYDYIISSDCDLKIKDFHMLTEKISGYIQDPDFLCAGRQYVNKYGFRCILATFNVFNMLKIKKTLTSDMLKNEIDAYYGLLDRYPGTNIHMHNYEENILGRIFLDGFNNVSLIDEQIINDMFKHYPYARPNSKNKDCLRMKRRHIYENIVKDSGFFDFLDKFSARTTFDGMLGKIKPEI